MAVGVPGIGYGASIGYGDGGSPEAFTSVGLLVDLGQGRQLEADEVETTSQASPGAGGRPYKEFISGAMDNGEAQFDVLLVENQATHAQVLADWKAGTKRNWQVLKPGGYGYKCAAFVKSIGEAVPLQDKMMTSITLRFSGAPTEVTP